MSRKCRLRSYKNIGEDGKWAADRIETLEAELANIKEVEFPKRVEKVAESWRGKCERLEAENAALREGFGEPVGWIMVRAIDDLKVGRFIELYRDKEDPDDIPLYARKSKM